MSNDDFLTDDYVAGLMAKEAKDARSIKFSSMGLESSSSSSNKPRTNTPNTRFLTKIIKSTDRHNSNLLAKEEAESQARLKDFERTEEKKRLRTNPNSSDIRRRQLAGIHTLLGVKKPTETMKEGSSSRRPEASRREKAKRSDEGKDDLFDKRDERKSHGRLAENDDDSHRKSSSGRSRRRSRSEDEERPKRQHGSKRDRSRSRSKDDERSKRQRRSKRDRSRSRSEDKERSRRRHRSSRNRSRSEDDERSKRQHRSKRDHDRNRSRSPRRRSRSPNRESNRHRHRSPPRTERALTPTAADEDSDPMEDDIGPQPAPQPRGRGATSGASGIDERFSESYDPAQDVTVEYQGPTVRDWDDPEVTYQSRLRLRLAHEEHLVHERGFTREDIRNMYKTGELNHDEHVKWEKEGVERKWDANKTKS